MVNRMGDLIERQAAIDAAIEAADDWDGGYNISRAEIIEKALEQLSSVSTGKTDAISRSEVLDLIDSKDPNYEVRHFKEDVECLDPIYTCTEDIPCTECPQYDKEKHYCPHFCRVIRDVFEEKTGHEEK